MNKKLLSIAILASLPVCSTSYAASVWNIDLFTANTNGEITDRKTGEGSWISSIADPGVSLGTYFNQTSAFDNSILGNYRNILVDKISATGNLNSFVSMSVTDGKLSFNNPSLNYGVGVVQWSGSNSIAGGTRANDYNVNYTGLSNFDLLGLGAVALEYTVFEADQGFPITFEAYTDANNYTRVTIQTSAASSSSPVTEQISLAAMQNGNLCGYQYTDDATAAALGLDNRVRDIACGGAYTFGSVAGQTVDFSNLGALQAIFNYGLTNAPATGAFDLTITGITAVPEPSIIGLLGAGLLAFGGFKGSRRRTVSLDA
jgi:hypothetical protein